MSETRTGGCLCGAVRFRVTMKEPSVGACHCESCRRWGGGPLMSIHCGPAIEIEDASAVRHYQSSDWAERGFCATCGSNLYYHLKPGPFAAEGEYIVSAGLLDDQSSLAFDHEVFVDGNPGWYGFAGEDRRKRMTKADIMAMVGADKPSE